MIDDELDVASLFDNGRIDKQVYNCPKIFELEQERIFRKLWHYVGYESQISNPGDFFTTEVMGEPILIQRGSDGVARAFYNRCSHRGTLLTRKVFGNSRRLVCSYHAWSFDSNGALKGIPMPGGYAHTELESCPSDYDLKQVPRFDIFQGFLFVSLTQDAEDLASFLGPAAINLVNMVERSPLGKIEPLGRVFSMTQRNNWKIYLENLHDGGHAMQTHQSSSLPAKKAIAKGEGKPWTQLQASIVAANAQNAEKMAALKVNCFERGHSDMMAFRQGRPDIDGQQEYEQALVASYGTERAQDILATDRHSAIFYPNVSVSPTFLQLRVIVPLAVDRTRVDCYGFRLKGVPDTINRRIVAFANMVNSPTSLVRADDLENFSRVQRGLNAGGVRWISAHREMASEQDPVGPSHAMSERYIRNQFHAWRHYMEIQ